MEEIAFLGHVISKQGVQPDSSKVKAILKWEAPKSVTEVQDFVGLASYYQRSVKEFLIVTKPLINLPKKNVSFSRYPQCQQSFEELKKRLATRPILALPSRNGGFVVYINGSRMVLGSVLMQMGRL